MLYEVITDPFGGGADAASPRFIETRRADDHLACRRLALLDIGERRRWLGKIDSYNFV